jgi:hypothetical protein
MSTWIPNTQAIVSLDNAVGSLTDISNSCSTVSIDMTASIGVFYTFGSPSANKSEGKRDFKASLGVRPSEDAADAARILNAWSTGAGAMGARTLRVDTPDASSGSLRIQGEVYLSAWQLMNQDASGDGTPPTQTASLEIDTLPTYSVL